MNTPQACRDLAAQDKARASTTPLANRRASFEASARIWNARAEELEKRDRLRATRLAAAAALKTQ